MRRRSVLKLLAAPAIVPVNRLAFGQTKKKVTYIYQLDPVYETALWAIRNGKVTSPLIDVEATAANIPTLIQSTATKQFDVVMTSTVAVATAQSRGLDLRILSAALYTSKAGENAGIWVNKDSPLKVPEDLRGKTLASFGLQSTGYMLMRAALAAGVKLNVALDGGDFRQVEVAAANLPAALATGRVDAATLINSQAFRATKSGEFRSICETDRIIIQHYGRLVNAVNVSYPERLAERKDDFVEFDRMLKASVEFALANRELVFGAVAKDTNIDPEFFDWRYDRAAEIPNVLGNEHIAAIETVWKIANNFGMVKQIPDAKRLAWEHALTG
jgi:NitT/TauT family transport system substrate-binding protein